MGQLCRLLWHGRNVNALVTANDLYAGMVSTIMTNRDL